MPLLRECTAGHKVAIYYGTNFNPKAVNDGRKKGCTHFLVIDDKLAKQSAKHSVIEKAYLAECAKNHSADEPITGMYQPMKHKIVNGGLELRKKR